MQKAYKVEIKPTSEQKIKIAKTFGVCKYIYNMFLAKNIELYNENKFFMSGYSFSVWLNNEFLPNNPEFMWIKDVGSKAVKRSIMNAENAFKKFFKKQAKFPRFKKHNSKKSFYFPRNNKKDLAIERHKVKIPTLGFVRIKEFGYIPVGYNAKSVFVSQIADKYYASFLFDDINDKIIHTTNNEAIGIDLGIKDTAIVSNGKIFKNINKTPKIKKIEKKLKHEQRALSRKLQAKKRDKQKSNYTNIRKNIMKVTKIHFRLSRIRNEYIRYIINSLIKPHNLPEYVAIEDLNVRGMMKNRHLSSAIQKQSFYYFRKYLIQKCKKYNVEVRIIDRWYPSSKTCHACGKIKSDLKLSDRIFKCECGNTVNRDINASLNIRDCKTYEIAN